VQAAVGTIGYQRAKNIGREAAPLFDHGRFEAHKTKAVDIHFVVPF
jgi:hypothetical protein